MIYCAGPFFNAVQKEHAIKLAKYLRMRKVLYYSPVEHQFVTGGKLNATEVFDRNIEAMIKSDLLLAQLDYPMPEGQELLINKKIGTHREIRIPIVLPDAGTVWEMGYAYKLGIPIVGYITKPTEKLNLMLVECCRGIVHDVFAYFKGGPTYDRSQEKKWEGGIV